MSDKCNICGDAGIVPYQRGIKCKEKLCPYWRQHQVNIGGCSKRFQYKRRCKLCVCVHSELQPRANTMSDKPKKIWRNESHTDDRDFIEYEESPCGHTSTEYIRADLAKPSEWIERKARAFDWFVAEMMDEELKILMEKGGYKTPLEAIEKAMIPPTRETP